MDVHLDTHRLSGAFLPETTLKELYGQSLEALPPILRSLGREKRLPHEELEDLQSDIQVKLLEDDYRVLRRWDSRSSLKTYLGTVVSNTWHDRIRSEKGKIRVSKAAEGLGPPAPELEMLLRQGLTLDEAYQVIKPRFPDLSRSEAEVIADQINPRRGRVFVNEGTAARLQALGPAGYERLEQLEKFAKKRKAFALMHQLLSELPSQDRLLLVRAHAEGVKFSRIAKSQGIDQRSLYARNERLLKKLRTDLEEAGIRWEDLSEVLGIDAPTRAAAYRMGASEPDEMCVEKHVEKRAEKALALMHQLLSELPEQDRLLLRACAEGDKLSSIARRQGIDAKSLYRRRERLLKKLRTDLEEAEIRWEDPDQVRGIAEALETGPGEQGKFRMSAVAKRLGPPALELEMLLGRQGLTLDEAYQVIKPRFPGLSRGEFDEIAAQTYTRRGRHFVGEEVLVDLPAPSAIPGHTGFREIMAGTETCVTPADLAVFLEGNLTEEERDRIVRHLNHCADCFERYIGTARLLDAIEEEEASTLSGRKA